MSAVGRGPHGALQVGPEQLFAAAQRAEAEGRIGYAVQVYHQLADAFPTTREAYDARDALARLMAPAAEQSFDVAHAGHAGHAHAGPALGSGSHVSSQQGHHAPQPAAYGGPGPSLQPPQPPMHLPPSQGQPRTGPPRAPAREMHPPMAPSATADAGLHAGHAMHPAPVAAPRREPVRRAPPTPAPVNVREAEPAALPGYRIGRLVAATLTSMGWMLFGLGVVVVGLVVAAFTVGGVPRGLREALIGQIPLTIAGTIGLFLVSLMAIFAGQTARATFDTAEAVRHLLMRDGDGRG